MSYADYSFYQDEYRAGMDPVITDEGVFSFWEKKARKEIDLVTFNRIHKLDSPPFPVKECVCELAELLYRADTLDSQDLSNGAAGPLTSYSNDGQSGSYDLSQSLYTVDGRKKEINRIIRLYLLHTGLMYKGVMDGE